MANIPPPHTVKGGDASVSGGNAGPHGKGGDFTMVGGTIKGGDAILSTPAEATKSRSSFWFHPITKTVLYILGVVIAAALIFFLGFKK